jgi:hypothetical protein
LEHAAVVRRANPKAKDEDRTRLENLVEVEVRQALDRDSTESPYLTYQLSVFDDWQHFTGLPEIVIGGLQRLQNLSINAKDSDLYWFRPLNSVIP